MTSSATPAGTPPPDRSTGVEGAERPPRLRATLRLPGGTLELAVGAGAAVRLPSDPAAVAALAGRGTWRARRTHRVTLDGRPLHRHGPARRVRAGLVTIGDAPVAADVTVRDHLAARTGPGEVDALLAVIPRLAGRGRDPAGVLSGGERRLLAWARAMVLAPRAVVLDRAATGLDADALRWAAEQLRDWRSSGVAVLVRPGRAEELGWLTAGPGPEGG